MSEGRQAPSDLEAERAVLSAVLLDASALARAAELLRPENFFSEPHRRIFEAALALLQKPAPVDIVSVAGWLRDTGRLQQVGGAAYLADLSGEVPAIAHADHYAKRVLDKWRLRQFITTCQRFAAEGYGDTGDIDEFLSNAENDLICAAGCPIADEEKTLGRCAAEAYQGIVDFYHRPEQATILATGLTKLDALLGGGLKPGKLSIVAANPGMGKSVLVQTVAINVARAYEGRFGVQIFSVEMEDAELGERALASESETDSARFRVGLSDDEWRQVCQAVSSLERLPIFVTDDGEITIAKIGRRVHRRRRDIEESAVPGKLDRKLGLVIVDYLQLVNTEQKKGQSREEAMSEAAKRLKLLAKREHVHVIAISSLNRELDKRPNKRPQLGDLRESGAIAFHADNILFLYRESFYHPDCAEPDVVECNLAKQRGGPVAMVKLRFNMQQSRFENLEGWAEEPPQQTSFRLPQPSADYDARYP